MKNNRIESLDSLRGIAAFVVVIFHTLISFKVFHYANYFNEFESDSLANITLSPIRLFWAGSEAVLLFFILSGFVLALPVFNGKKQYYPAYITKRFCRIYIPYIIVVAVSIGVSYFFRDFNNVEGLSRIYYGRWSADPSIESIFGFIFMLPIDTNANGVVWTLFHELRISIVLPLIYFIITKFRLIKSFMLTTGACVTAFVLFYGINILVPNETISVILNDFAMTAYYAVFFVFGAFLAKYREKTSVIKNIQLWFKLALFVLSLLLINNRWLIVPLKLDVFVIENIISAIGILILFALALNSELMTRVLTQKPLLWLGKVSFSLYLIHIPVIMMSTIFLSKIISIEFSFVFAILISLPIAGLTYKFAEIPAIKVGKKVSKLIIDKSKDRINSKKQNIS